MNKPLADFDAIARVCLIVGAVFGLLALKGLFGEDPAIALQRLKASGVNMPITIPSAALEYRRLLAALELIPDLLLVGVGWGLLKKKPWSVSALKGVAWLFLVKAVLGVGWTWWTLRPGVGPEAPMQSTIRAVALGSAAVMTLLWVVGLSWLLWRLRGAKMEQAAQAA